MNTHVIFVHGFNVYDSGAGTVGRLRPYFEQRGCTTEMLSYGHFNLFAPRWKNRSVAEKLAERVRDIKSIGMTCIVVGHSNGAAITHLAGEEFQAPIDKAIYINPALDRAVRFPDSFKAFDVWHNPRDNVVKLSRLLPFHPWGDMGATGYTRFDYRGKNYNMLTNFDLPSSKHSSIFHDPAIKVFGPIIADRGLSK